MLFIASLWNEKAAKWIKGRRSVLKQIRQTKRLNCKTIWFHCASVGEYEPALPLIGMMEEQYGQYQILVTFYSPSGYEYAKAKYPSQCITYLPLDTVGNVKAFIAEADPVAVFVIKYEFWYHLLATLKRKHIPVFLVSGIFRKEQLFFHFAGGFYRKILHFFTHFFVQDQESLDLLRSVQIENVTVAGDTRFDRVLSNRNSPFSDAKIETFTGHDPVFIAGSVWNTDIPVLRSIMDALPAGWKILIAPHEIAHFQTDWIREPFCTYSSLQDSGGRVMIIDTMGILSKLYRLSTFVYVGGGFGRGIHNILEPAVYLKPVLIGQNYHKFKEARDLLALGGAFSVNSENAGFLVKNTMLDENKYLQIVNLLNAYITANSNLSEKILVFVGTYLRS
jgi:3-deoxy-D-manno-octulosonic-acid transferase